MSSLGRVNHRGAFDLAAVQKYRVVSEVQRKEEIEFVVRPATGNSGVFFDLADSVQQYRLLDVEAVQLEL